MRILVLMKTPGSEICDLLTVANESRIFREFGKGKKGWDLLVVSVINK